QLGHGGLEKGLGRDEIPGKVAAQGDHDDCVQVHDPRALLKQDPLRQMTFYPTDRLALFIDGANLYSAAKGLGFDIDYRKLLEEFRKRGKLIRAYYYTALVEDQEYSPIRPLVDWLDYNGFRLVTKPAREYTDAQGRKRWRGDMDVEIAVDMME